MLEAAAGFAALGLAPGERVALIGAGMVPHGEVGLIFASLGKETGALPEVGDDRLGGREALAVEREPDEQGG